MLFRKAVLFIHGFSAYYRDNEYFINYLQKYPKLDVYTFTLPGHDQPKMEKVKYTDWIAACEKQMDILLETYHQVYVVGHSMGGLLATYLASKYSEVKKLVLIAPGFQFINMEQNKKDLKNMFDKKIPKEQKDGFKGLLSKIFTVPVTNLVEFTKMMKEFQNYPQEVVCPTLILHGDIDNVVPYSASTYVFDSLASEVRYLTTISGVRHQVFVSKKKEEISHYIYLFLKDQYRFKRQYKEEI